MQWLWKLKVQATVVCASEAREMATEIKEEPKGSVEDL